MKGFALVVAVVAVAAGVAASPAAAESCNVPVLPNWNFTSLTVSDVPCAEAREVAVHVVRNGAGPGDWLCSATVRGRPPREGGGLFVSWACVDRLIVSRKIDFTYLLA
jgi:hypothetical protein